MTRLRSPTTRYRVATRRLRNAALEAQLENNFLARALLFYLIFILKNFCEVENLKNHILLLV